MDRFKFRVWCCNNNEWEKDEILISNRGNFKIYRNGIYFGTMKDRPNFHVLEQCTGLKDKNGKLIYEGDIIKYGSKTFKIIFNQGIASFTVELSKAPKWYPCVNKGTMESVEVIGNIHENPELLESEGNNA